MKPGLKRGGKIKKKPKLGTGKRFKQLSSKLKKKGAKDPKALAAWIAEKFTIAPSFGVVDAKHV